MTGETSTMSSLSMNIRLVNATVGKIKAAISIGSDSDPEQKELERLVSFLESTLAKQNDILPILMSTGSDSSGDAIELSLDKTEHETDQQYIGRLQLSIEQLSLKHAHTLKSLEHECRAHQACHQEVHRLRQIIKSLLNSTSSNDETTISPHTFERIRNKVLAKLDRYLVCIADVQRDLQESAILSYSSSTLTSSDSTAFLNQIKQLGDHIQVLQTCIRLDRQLLTETNGVKNTVSSHSPFETASGLSEEVDKHFALYERILDLERQLDISKKKSIVAESSSIENGEALKQAKLISTEEPFPCELLDQIKADQTQECIPDYPCCDISAKSAGLGSNEMEVLPLTGDDHLESIHKEETIPEVTNQSDPSDKNKFTSVTEEPSSAQLSVSENIHTEKSIIEANNQSDPSKNNNCGDEPSNAQLEEAVEDAEPSNAQLEEAVEDAEVIDTVKTSLAKENASKPHEEDLYINSGPRREPSLIDDLMEWTMDSDESGFTEEDKEIAASKPSLNSKDQKESVDLSQEIPRAVDLKASSDYLISSEISAEDVDPVDDSPFHAIEISPKPNTGANDSATKPDHSLEILKSSEIKDDKVHEGIKKTDTGPQVTQLDDLTDNFWNLEDPNTEFTVSESEISVMPKASSGFDTVVIHDDLEEENELSITEKPAAKLLDITEVTNDNSELIKLAGEDAIEMPSSPKSFEKDSPISPLSEEIEDPEKKPSDTSILPQINNSQHLETNVQQQDLDQSLLDEIDSLLMDEDVKNNDVAFATTVLKETESHLSANQDALNIPETESAADIQDEPSKSSKEEESLPNNSDIKSSAIEEPQHLENFDDEIDSALNEIKDFFEQKDPKHDENANEAVFEDKSSVQEEADPSDIIASEMQSLNDDDEVPLQDIAKNLSESNAPKEASAAYVEQQLPVQNIIESADTDHCALQDADISEFGHPQDVIETEANTSEKPKDESQIQVEAHDNSINTWDQNELQKSDEYPIVALQEEFNPEKSMWEDASSTFGSPKVLPAKESHDTSSIYVDEFDFDEPIQRGSITNPIHEQIPDNNYIDSAIKESVTESNTVHAAEIHDKVNYEEEDIKPLVDATQTREKTFENVLQDIKPDFVAPHAHIVASDTTKELEDVLVPEDLIEEEDKNTEKEETPQPFLVSDTNELSKTDVADEYTGHSDPISTSESSASKQANIENAWETESDILADLDYNTEDSKPVIDDTSKAVENNEILEYGHEQSTDNVQMAAANSEKDEVPAILAVPEVENEAIIHVEEVLDEQAPPQIKHFPNSADQNPYEKTKEWVTPFANAFNEFIKKTSEQFDIKPTATSNGEPEAVPSDDSADQVHDSSSTLYEDKTLVSDQNKETLSPRPQHTGKETKDNNDYDSWADDAHDDSNDDQKSKIVDANELKSDKSSKDTQDEEGEEDWAHLGSKSVVGGSTGLLAHAADINKELDRQKHKSEIRASEPVLSKLSKEIGFMEEGDQPENTELDEALDAITKDCEKSQKVLDNVAALKKPELISPTNEVTVDLVKVERPPCPMSDAEIEAILNNPYIPDSVKQSIAALKQQNDDFRKELDCNEVVKSKTAILLQEQDNIIQQLKEENEQLTKVAKEVIGQCDELEDGNRLAAIETQQAKASVKALEDRISELEAMMPEVNHLVLEKREVIDLETLDLIGRLKKIWKDLLAMYMKEANMPNIAPIKDVNFILDQIDVSIMVVGSALRVAKTKLGSKILLKAED